MVNKTPHETNKPPAPKEVTVVATEPPHETSKSATRQLSEAAETVQEDTRSVAKLLGELVADAQHLVRQELELAKHEVRQEVNKAAKSAIGLAVGAGIAAIGGILLLFMLVFLIADIAEIALWLSFLIVGAVITALGIGLLLWGKSKAQRVDPVPHQTVENVRKDMQWIQEQSPSSKK